MQKQMSKRALHIITFICVIAALPIGIMFIFSEWSPSAIRYSVTSSADDVPVITFDQRTINYQRKPFRTLGIYELSLSEAKIVSPTWTIHQTEGSNQKLVSLTYGVCPPGFEQDLLPKPLLTGHFYMIGSAPSNVIRKNAPYQYEVISYEQYRDAVSDRQSQNAK